MGVVAVVQKILGGDLKFSRLFKVATERKARVRTKKKPMRTNRECGRFYPWRGQLYLPLLSVEVLTVKRSRASVSTSANATLYSQDLDGQQR